MIVRLVRKAKIEGFGDIKTMHNDVDLRFTPQIGMCLEFPQFLHYCSYLRYIVATGALICEDRTGPYRLADNEGDTLVSAGWRIVD